MNTTAPPSVATAAGSAVPPDDIRGIKAPVEIAGAWAWLGWALAAAALTAMAAWLWRRRRRKKEDSPLEAAVPPHDRALQRLAEALGLIEQPRPFCILVSDTIRLYLEERFDLRAPERTTEEFLDELQASALLTLDQKQTLGEFLGRCDLVKFARYEPRRPELEALYQAAVRLVEETQPPPPLPGAGMSDGDKTDDAPVASNPANV
jgi:hypothetical protein